LTIGQTHEAYENVLSSIVAGDRLYTPTTEEILAQWKIVDEILAIYGGKVEEY
jgi:glucose-6-phosphate 1-dehydrogenase